MAVPTNTLNSITAVGNREDLSNELSLISPDSTPFMSNIGKATANAAFTEFDRDAHVVEPFEIPKGWQRFRAADWGYSSPACCLWFAIDYDNNLWVYRELYTQKITADVFARKVLDLEHGEYIRDGV